MLPSLSRAILIASAAVLLLAGAVPAQAQLFRKKQEEAGTLVIPTLESAREQYGYAVAYQRGTPLSPIKERRSGQIDKMIECYNKVIELWPEDRIYTPKAHFDIAQCREEQGHLQDAIRIYEGIIATYPEDDMLVARSMYNIAICLERLGRFGQSKERLKVFIERYRTSQDQRIQSMVRRAEALYLQARVEKPTQSDEGATRFNFRFPWKRQ